MLGLQSPLHLFGDGLWQPEFLHGLFQGLQVALRPRLLSLEPLTLLVQAVLPGFLQSLVRSCGLGHGSLLRFVAVPRSWHGGDHDPFFMGYQALSHGLDDSAASVAASDKKRTSQSLMTLVETTTSFKSTSSTNVSMGRRLSLLTVGFSASI